MAAGTLVAHKDAARVPEEIIRAVPSPGFTQTWRPYAHGDILDAIGAAFKARSLEVARKEYSMTASGSRIFGVWEVKSGDEEMNFAMGFRNSVDKHFAAGLCAGERVFVCDNLVFDGEFVLFRKHSGLLTLAELQAMAEEAISEVLDRFQRFKAWHVSLRRTNLSVAEASVLTLGAVRSGLLAPTSLPNFQELYFGPNYEASFHGWHGAMTELFRDQSLLTVHSKNAELNGFLAHLAPRLLARRHDEILDFEALSKEAAAEAESKRSVELEERREVAIEIKSKVRKRFARKSSKELWWLDAQIIRDSGGRLVLPCGGRLRGVAKKKAETAGR